MPLEVIGITYYVMLLSFELLSFLDLLVLSMLAIPVLGIPQFGLAIGLTAGVEVFCGGQIVHRGQLFTIAITLTINYLLAFSLLHRPCRSFLPRILTILVLYCTLLFSFSGDPLALLSSGAWYRTCLFFSAVALTIGVLINSEDIEISSCLDQYRGNIRQMLVARLLLAVLIGVQIQLVLSLISAFAQWGKSDIHEHSRIRIWLLRALLVIPLAQIFLQFWIQLIITKFKLVHRFLPYVLSFDSEPKFLPGSAELIGISSVLLLLMAGCIFMSKCISAGSRRLYGVVTFVVAGISWMFLYGNEPVYQLILLLLVFGIALIATFTAASGRALCTLTMAGFFCGALCGNLPVYYIKKRAFVYETPQAVAHNDKSGRASIEAAYELGLVGGSTAIVQAVRGNFNPRIAVDEMCDESLIAEGIWRRQKGKSVLCSEFSDLREALDITNCEDKYFRDGKNSLEEEISRTAIMLSHHSRTYNFCSNPGDDVRTVSPSGWFMLFYEIVQGFIRLVAHVYDLLQILSYGIRLQFLDRPVYFV